MSRPPTLYEKIDSIADDRDFRAGLSSDFGLGYIADNLNKDYTIRPYQYDAINRMAHYFERYKEKNSLGSHILFNMATGSGKTLIMASAILYFYTKGYRNFLFFVNSDTIIEKTKRNFLDKLSSKYQFNKDSIVIDGQRIEIKEVDNFTHSDSILFTTIHGLHSKITNPSENMVSVGSLKNTKIVLLSDEAHHINSATKNGDTEDEKSWETTAQKVFTAHTDNVMLEFTATIDLDKQEILRKYLDKIIYKYDLRAFRLDGYSKDVFLYPSKTNSKQERMLQAVILSQYRRKLAGKNGINLKPIILMKSKLIKESKESYLEFIDMINSLKVSEVKKVIQSIEDKKAEHIMKSAFAFLENENISLADFVQEIKIEFTADKVLEINQKDQSDEKQIILNSLEDTNNPYRVIFAVDMLNEGWDVLNLFDIVRLYEKRDDKDGKAGTTTIKEAQLVGRGARYFPFKLSLDQDKDKRKYDDERNNELRVLEQLYFYSTSDSRYIDVIKRTLKESGIYEDTSDQKNALIKIKDEFKKTDFYKTAKVYTNELIKNDNKEVTDLKSFDILRVYDGIDDYTASYVEGVFTDPVSNKNKIEFETKQEKIKDIYKKAPNVMRKVLDRIPFYSFDNLKSYLPHLTSKEEFFSSPNYCGDLQVVIRINKGSEINLHSKSMLIGLVRYFEVVKSGIQKGTPTYKGSDNFVSSPLHKVIKDVELLVRNEGNTLFYDDEEKGKSIKGPNTKYQLNTDLKEWYVYDDNHGTDQEKLFVHYINNNYDKLKKKYDDVYVIRNEKFIKIFNFSNGQATEPDFILYLTKKKSKQPICYQIFIEPKGAHLMATDKWKEELLVSINKTYKPEKLIDDSEYTVFGLPFFNVDDNRLTKKDFDYEFSKLLD